MILFLGQIPVLIAAVGMVWYYFSPAHTDKGYRPQQPVKYSHAFHAGELGLDCRYCHHSVESSAHANIPSTDVCMNCHTAIKTESPEIKKIIASYESGQPIAWKKVHLLPDHAYFDHSAHLNAGVSCVSCHGRVDKMEVVYQARNLSMAWCLECHRNPEEHLRPKAFITDLDWEAQDPLALGASLRREHAINPREDCSTCHR